MTVVDPPGIGIASFVKEIPIIGTTAMKADDPTELKESPHPLLRKMS